MSDTVCIAAVCVHGTRRFFAVLCSDNRIEIEGLTSGKIGHKAIGIAAGMSAMFSGHMSKTKELIDRYIAFFRNPETKRTPENILDLLKVPLENQNRADVAGYLSATYGMEYAEWLQLDEDAQKNFISGLPGWRTYCQLIIIWQGPEFVRLFLVTDRVEEMASFATIGIGNNAATAALFARDYTPYHDLREAIYYVYEAKRASESVPGVGKETHLSILEFSGEVRGGWNIQYQLNSRELDRLSAQYARFGPRPYEKPSPVADAALDLSFIPDLN